MDAEKTARAGKQGNVFVRMKTALIIPAYRPGQEMLELIEQFRGREEFSAVVVDDGSGEAYRAIFDALPDGVRLLCHEVNRGKGAALKTAMAHVLKEMPECELALTADADGQHRMQDILRVNEAARAHAGALVLGSRRFEGDVPLRSRLGNGITRQVFAAASGRRVYDTQTGLRAFDRDAMARFLEVPGERYEYEINMLLDAAQSGMPIHEETIETVYLNDNASSHFNPFRDSIKIYMCIFKFCASSLASAVIDYVLVLLLNALSAGLGPEASLALSVVGARMVSASVNFCINRRVVFRGNETLGHALAKYAALALCILAANYALMRLLTIHLRWPLALAKLAVEGALLILSFTVQGRFVYRKKQKV